MSRLLVNAPIGVQELHDVGPGGGYFEPARVLWDERKDGPLPPVTVGAAVREGNTLKEDAAQLAAHQARLAEIEAARPRTFDERLSALEAAARAAGWNV